MPKSIPLTEKNGSRAFSTALLAPLNLNHMIIQILSKNTTLDKKRDFSLSFIPEEEF